MAKTKVPCALVTSMDRYTTDQLLDKLGLRQFFTCLVTGGRTSKHLLGAARGSATVLQAGALRCTVCRECLRGASCSPRRPELPPGAADDDMETISQRYLSAAIKLGRPPNQCVVFAACPTSITGARRGADWGAGQEEGLLTRAQEPPAEDKRCKHWRGGACRFL